MQSEIDRMKGSEVRALPLGKYRQGLAVPPGLFSSQRLCMYYHV